VIKVTFRHPGGEVTVIEAQPGTSLMRTAVGNGITEVVAECGGTLSPRPPGNPAAGSAARSRSTRSWTASPSGCPPTSTEVLTASETVVVLGAGQAGCQLVSSLTEAGFEGHVVLVGDEAHPPYQRPPLSKAYLTGTGDRGDLWLRPEAWFADNGVELLLRTAAGNIDLAAASVQLSGGRTIGYDHLVLALGCRHRVRAGRWRFLARTAPGMDR